MEIVDYGIMSEAQGSVCMSFEAHMSVRMSFEARA